jgi:hypothetical protein
MGVTALSFSAVVNVPSGRLLGNNGVSTGPAVALTSTQVFAVLATGTPSATTDLRGDGTWATVSAGIGGSTGGTDNAVLRADGTGGATLQNSAFVIADNATASPNATVNHASIQATGDTTNVSVSIVPKGTGSFSLQVPDGTATGGNARGANAVDLQTSRSAATQVASGLGAVAIGRSNTASGDLSGSIAIGTSNNAAGRGSGSIAIGSSNTAGDGTQSACYVAIGASVTTTGFFGVGIGDTLTVSGVGAAAFGFNNVASASYSIILGGRDGNATRYGQVSKASGQFAAQGDCQQVQFLARNKTTTNSAVTLFLDGSSARLTIPSGKILHATAHIIGSKSDGTAIAVYMRQVAIANVGGTVSLVGTVNTLGTDTAAGTTLAITADNTNKALDIAPTGVTSETWRWTAVVYGVEMAYGT